MSRWLATYSLRFSNGIGPKVCIFPGLLKGFWGRVLTFVVKVFWGSREAAGGRAQGPFIAWSSPEGVGGFRC